MISLYNISFFGKLLYLFNQSYIASLTTFSILNLKFVRYSKTAWIHKLYTKQTPKFPHHYLYLKIGDNFDFFLEDKSCTQMNFFLFVKIGPQDNQELTVSAYFEI